jgi:hypothetical protein
MSQSVGSNSALFVTFDQDGCDLAIDPNGPATGLMQQRIIVAPSADGR